MPRILDGYCNKSDKPKEEAEAEARGFLQVIEDASSYMFGMNHSIAYCLLGYLCAYYRYYHPVEFITSFLNNATNEEDIRNGTMYAKIAGVQVTLPKWGYSKSAYYFDSENRVIAKGLSSIKYMNDLIAEELYDIAHNFLPHLPQSDTLFGQKIAVLNNNWFVDVLSNINLHSSLNTRQLDILIKIDFFSQFGNQRELLYITDVFYNLLNKGNAKQISKEKAANTPWRDLISTYSIGFNKDGSESKSYTIVDMHSLLVEIEQAILNEGLPDLDDAIKVRHFKDAMGYIGYVSGKDEDRRKLYVIDIFPLNRKRDGKQFGYSIITKSIGSGKESRFTVFNRLYDKLPIHKDDIIICRGYTREGQYYTLTDYNIEGKNNA